MRRQRPEMGFFPTPRSTIALVVLIAAVAACSAEADTATSVPAHQTTVPTTSTTSTTLIPGTSTTTSTPESAVEPAEPLLVIGDWGSGTEPQGAVAGAMSRYAETHAVTGILTTGDNFYTDDASFLMQPFSWAVDAGIPFWVVWGNHDIESQQRIDAVNAVFDSPQPWTLHQWGRFDVMILDSNQVTDQDQLRFIEEEMATREGPMIVAFHEPPYSCSKHGPDQEEIESWLPLFDDDVVLVLSGHEHNYQRFSADDISWVVTGGGGRRLYGIGDCPADHPEPEYSTVTNHFVVLEDSGTTLTVTAYDVLGEILDTVDIVVP